MDKSPSPLSELTSEYVQTHWREVVERVRAGERLRVPSAGIAIVPLEAEEEAMRAWGRRELAKILDVNRISEPAVSDDEAMALSVEEVRAHRAERAAQRKRSA